MSIEDGIKVVVNTCMKIQPGEKVVIITDDQTMDIGKKLRKEVSEKTNDVRFFNLDIYGNRPLDKLPERIEKKTKEATATFFIGRSIKDELDSVRRPMINAGVVSGRHAHMIGLTEDVIARGLNVDYEQVAEFTDEIYSLVDDTEEIKIRSDNGTDLKAKVGRYKWVPSSGICDKEIQEAGEWLNLPDGEVFTTPDELEGIAVIDGSIGDYFTEMFDLAEIKKKPLKVEIEQKNRPTIVDVESDNKKLEKEFQEYIDAHTCSKWIGQLGFGTNIFIEEMIGEILIDRKSPNAHITAGNPNANLTFADWTCPEAADLLIPNCDIWFDEKKVMENGSYTIV